MSQIIALGQTVHVHCARCGRQAWRVSVMLGTQKLMCSECNGKTVIKFYVERDLYRGSLFKMDVRPSFWS